MKWPALLVAVLLVPAQAAAEPRPTLIAMDPAGGGDAVVSADGQFILTSSQRNGVSAIWMYGIAERTWSQITDGQGGDREPAWSPDSRRAVFVSGRGGQTDLWIVDIATRAIRRLTDDSAEEEYPSWSSDGRLIAFTGGPWKNRNFFVVEPDGGAPRAVLRESGNVGACSFANGSSRLVCHSYDSELGNLIEIDIASGNSRRLTKVDRWYYKPTVSPDGRWIAVTDIGDDGERIRFLPHMSSATDVMPTPAMPGRWPMFLAGDRLFYHRQIDSGIELQLHDRQSGSTETIAVGNWMPGRGSLSPDQRRIAYCAADSAGRSRIFVHDRDAGTRRSIELGADACFPAWSPDGSQLAFTVKQGERWEIGLADRTGGNLRVLTSPNGKYHFLNNGPLAWKPDGRQIAFTGVTKPYESNIFLVDVASRVIDHVSQGPWYDEGPSFSADGASIAFMSTRGGNWTWGLFSLKLSDRTISTMLDPELIERRFPVRVGDDLYWLESNVCLNTTMLAVRHGSEPPQTRSEFSGLKWFEISADGRYVLTTTRSRRTEFWMLDLSTAF